MYFKANYENAQQFPIHTLFLLAKSRREARKHIYTDADAGTDIDIDTDADTNTNTGTSRCASSDSNS